MTEKEKPKETPPTRLHTLLRGGAILAGSIAGGVLLLALIGWIPGHQESLILQPVLWIVSLAAMAGTLWGIWLIIKAVLGFR